MVKTLSRKWQPKTKVIVDKNGKLLTNIDEIFAKWKEYCEELYNHEAQRDPEIITMLTNEESQHQYDKELPIIKDEVIVAIKKLKNDKSPKTDNITAELLKGSGTPLIDNLHKISNMIIDSGEWPDRRTELIMTPLPKKGNTKKFSNNRKIILINHSSKVLLYIMLARMKSTVK